MKILLIVLVPFVILGGLVGAGIVHIPGINDPPKKSSKKQPKALGDEPKVETKVLAKKAEPTQEGVSTVQAKAAKPKATIDPNKGAERLAKLWNEMDVATLSKIAGEWKDEDLVNVLAVMDNAKVAELITSITVTDPKRASALSKQLQTLASVIPPAESKPSA